MQREQLSLIEPQHLVEAIVDVGGKVSCDDIMKLVFSHSWRSLPVTESRSGTGVANDAKQVGADQ